MGQRHYKNIETIDINALMETHIISDKDGYVKLILLKFKNNEQFSVKFDSLEFVKDYNNYTVIDNEKTEATTFFITEFVLALDKLLRNYLDIKIDNADDMVYCTLKELIPKYSLMTLATVIIHCNGQETFARTLKDIKKLVSRKANYHSLSKREKAVEELRFYRRHEVSKKIKKQEERKKKGLGEKPLTLIESLLTF